METYTVATTVGQSDDSDGDRSVAIKEYLTANGVTVGAMSVRNLPSPALVIEASADPTALLQAWTPTPSAERRDAGDSLTWLRETYLPVLRAWKAGTGPAPTIGQVTRATAELTIVDLALAKRMGVS